MTKRFSRSLVGAVLVSAAFASQAAHAGVTVSIDQEAGSTLASAPGLPDFSPGYPPEVVTTITGTASFDNDESGVLVQLLQKPAIGEIDPVDSDWDPTKLTDPQDDIVVYSDQASQTCDAQFACTWLWRIPFFLPPGEYTIRATAAQVNEVDPNQPGLSAVTSTAVTIL